MFGRPSRAVFTALLILGFFAFLTGCAGRRVTGEPPQSGSPNSPPVSGEVPGGSQNVPPVNPSGKAQELPGMVMVSVGNNEGARPQSGINEATIVFEIPTEGGISRLFLGFTRQVDRIGPVRSARKAMVEFALGYAAPFGHCGASNDAYALIRETGAPSLNDIKTAGGCFWRDKAGEPPDNLYTSTENIVKFARANGFMLSKPPEFRRGDLQGKEATYIEYDFSWLSRYPNVVSYTFEEGEYRRSQVGKGHFDSAGVRVGPENLVFMEVKTDFVRGEAIELRLHLTSEGKALFFSGGKVQEGIWSKKALRSPVEFFIGQKPASFEEGQIWIHIVRDISLVKYR